MLLSIGGFFWGRGVQRHPKDPTKTSCQVVPECLSTFQRVLSNYMKSLLYQKNVECQSAYFCIIFSNDYCSKNKTTFAEDTNDIPQIIWYVSNMPLNTQLCVYT